MQKITVLAIIAAVLALMPFASAANAYTLEEFSKEKPMQAYILEERDILDFNLLGGTHRLWLKEISRSNKSIKLNIFSFSNKPSMAEQVPLFGLENLVKVDLDKNGEDDVLLDILEIKDRRVTLAVASSEFIAEAEEDALQETPEITGTPQGQGIVTEQKNYSKTFWAIGIAIVVLAVIIYVRAIEAKEKKTEKHKKEGKSEE